MYAHHQKLTIIGRPTKSVTIFASSAQVVREFDDIIIRPGINVYTITHLSQYADLSSFQVAGHGISATILDTSAKVLQEAQVAADSDSDSATPSSSEDEFDRDSIIATLPAGQRRQEIENKLTAIRHSRASLDLEKTVLNKEIAGWELLIQKLLDNGSDGGVADHSAAFGAIKACMESYHDVLGKSHSRFSEIMVQLQENDTREQNLQRELEKIDKKLERKLQSAYSRHNTLRAKRELRKAEKNLKSGFPYTVLTITLEAKTAPDDTNTPEITATTDAGKPKHLVDNTPPSDAIAPTLRISYAVNYIHWIPCFHISLSTTALTGELHHTAEILNTSREAFMDAEVALSTAHQQPWKHIGAQAPLLPQWRIGVSKDGSSNGIAQSKYERENKRTSFMTIAGGGGKQAMPWGNKPSQPVEVEGGGRWKHASEETSDMSTPPGKATGCLFGRSKATQGAVTMGGLFGSAATTTPATGFGSVPIPTTVPVPTVGAGLFGAQPALNAAGMRKNLFGSAGIAPGSTTTGFGSSSTAPAQTSGGLFGQRSNPNPHPYSKPFNFTPAAPTTHPRTTSSPPPLPYNPTATFTTATSTTHTHGTTTTYTLGRKSLLSTLTSAITTPTTHHLSTTSIPSITLTHHVTPKISPLAFVNAFIPLPASAPHIPESTPLKLTVDYHVLGIVPVPSSLNIFLPLTRSILLPLGADSNVGISYSAPDPETRTEGLLRTTRVSTHRREWIVRNNSTREITIKVRDQIPVVSPEEKSLISVTVLQPKGVQEIVEARKRLDEWNSRVREAGGDVASVKDPMPAVERWKVELPVGECDIVARGVSVLNPFPSSSSSPTTSQEKEKHKQEDYRTEIKKENNGTCEPVGGLDGVYDGVEWKWSVEAGGVRRGVLVWEVRSVGVNTTGENGAVVSLT